MSGGGAAFDGGEFAVGVAIRAGSLRFVRERFVVRERYFREERLSKREAERSVRARKLKSLPSFNRKRRSLSFPATHALGRVII